MKNEWNNAKEELKKGDYSCVICRNGKFYTTRERGIKPLIDWKDSGIDMRGFYAADRIVGKAAAMLYVLLGVRAVYAPVMSESAVRVFLRYGIDYECDTQVKLIINRKGTGICPMENAVKDMEDPEEGYAVLKKKVQWMQSGNGMKGGQDE